MNPGSSTGSNVGVVRPTQRMPTTIDRRQQRCHHMDQSWFWCGGVGAICYRYNRSETTTNAWTVTDADVRAAAEAGHHIRPSTVMRPSSSSTQMPSGLGRRANCLYHHMILYQKSVVLLRDATFGTSRFDSILQDTNFHQSFMRNYLTRKSIQHADVTALMPD